jgi:hypothetical protein
LAPDDNFELGGQLQMDKVLWFGITGFPLTIDPQQVMG